MRSCAATSDAVPTLTAAPIPPDELPPAQIPGYHLERRLGRGAYGEVWVGSNGITGRRVAIKFYRRRAGAAGGRGLGREVEKLAVLSADRYVVQLLDVGWHADPPYYVMEYVENGSLQDLLDERAGSDGRDAPAGLPVAQAVELFAELAHGLNHVHAKGLLHCDLKPANVLLDQDLRPRLADFGQARRSHGGEPALGTLFYMAPEQADLEAIPDAKWDVYALGAILYATLTGRPPHETPETLTALDEAAELDERLSRYRALIRARPAPDAHRTVPGVDRALADVVSRCLAAEPASRFANVQEVLNALEARAAAGRRRPLLLLGGLGPLLLLVIGALAGFRGYRRAIAESDVAVTARVQESNGFAAQYVASKVAAELERYSRAAEALAEDPAFRALVASTTRTFAPELARLGPTRVETAALEETKERLRRDPRRAPLQRELEGFLRAPDLPPAASWLVTDARGTQLASAFHRALRPTVGENFAYRSYFHGGPRDREPGTGACPLSRTHLSAPLESTATKTWKIAVSTPVRDPEGGRRVVGVLAVTIEIGNLVTLFERDRGAERRFPILVDGRPGGFRGLVLQHPLFAQVYERDGTLPPRFATYRVEEAALAGTSALYEDPLARDPLGAAYAREWVAAAAEVVLPPPGSQGGAGAAVGAPLHTGLFVLVQEDRSRAVAPVRQLGRALARDGALAAALFVAVVLALWALGARGLAGRPRRS